MSPVRTAQYFNRTIKFYKVHSNFFYYHQCYILYIWYAMGHDSASVRTLGSQLREPGLESSFCHFEALAISLIPHCHSSLSCINKYLATDRGGYLNKQSSRSNCSMAECFPEKSKWHWNEQVCQGVNCKVL